MSNDFRPSFVHVVYSKSLETFKNEQFFFYWDTDVITRPMTAYYKCAVYLGCEILELIEENLVILGHPDSCDPTRVQIDTDRFVIFLAKGKSNPKFNYNEFGKFLYNTTFCKCSDNDVSPYGFSDNVLKKIDELNEALAVEPRAIKTASTHIIDGRSVLRLYREYFAEQLGERVKDIKE